MTRALRPAAAAFLLAAVVLVGTVGAARAGTLDDVRHRGSLKCGINTGLAGFAAPDDKGVWHGFDVDFCRAVAAAVFGDASKVQYTHLTTKNRFTALRSGEVDMLSRDTTWTFSRDVDLQLTFVGIVYYDGQGFMVPKKLEVKSATELDGASVCIQTGTTTELNLNDYFKRHHMRYEPVPIDTSTEARAAYLAGRCDVYTTDSSGLAVIRAGFDRPDAHVILPEIVSKEPLGLIVRQGDDQWADIVRWTLNAMIAGLEHGITSANVRETAKDTASPEVARLLGKRPLQGIRALGLAPDWAVKVLAQVGNYGEVFDRNLGPLGLKRSGANRLWENGGLLYAPPFR